MSRCLSAVSAVFKLLSAQHWVLKPASIPSKPLCPPLEPFSLKRIEPKGNLNIKHRKHSQTKAGGNM